ncbi:hypothetical protein ACHAXR_009683 [Thalassiosira sp. AJA248-18]
MSLSFVKSAVLSSTDGISHNEETTIDNKETQSLRASGGGSQKPLFEQLRANKDAEQEKDDEFQRSLRGTRALDEEDCAHLDSIDRMRTEKEYTVKSGIEREVALFHAAREDRGLAQTVVEGGDNDDDGAEEVAREGDGSIKANAEPATVAITKKEVKKIVPKFTIKKKRKRASQQSDSNNCTTDTKRAAVQKGETTNEACEGKQHKESKNSEGKSKLSSSQKTTNDSDSDENGGLLGLGCYGSDSD